VIPPENNLYLLDKTTKDPKTGRTFQKRLGFADFFDLNLLNRHEVLRFAHVASFCSYSFLFLTYQHSSHGYFINIIRIIMNKNKNNNYIIIIIVVVVVIIIIINNDNNRACM
jgi:hypothetical protein